MSFSEWEEVRLGDLCVKLGSGVTPKGGDSVYKETGVSLIRSQNIYDFTFEYSGLAHIDDEQAKKMKNVEIQENDVLINITGDSVARCCIVPIDVLPARVNQHVMIVRPNSELLEPHYLQYTLNSPRVKEYLLSLASTGGTRKALTKNMLENLKITIPSLGEQILISRVLTSLDSKIQKNNQINKNLEETAQAIFKRWFIDFEFPNENGEPYKSSGGEMGLIPKVWQVVKLADLGDIITGKTPSSKQIDSFGEKYNFITPRDINNSIYILNSERLLSEIGSERLKTIRIKKNSIGVSCIGSNLGEVYINDKEGFTNQQINSLILDKEEIYPYVYITLKNMKEDFLNLAGGSAVPIINKTSFSAIKIVMPDEATLDKFIEKVTVLFEKIKINLIENCNLTELRDSLLPKLMSGEIRVPLDEI
jgi:type I restriction enzyme S subunit